MSSRRSSRLSYFLSSGRSERLSSRRYRSLDRDLERLLSIHAILGQFYQPETQKDGCLTVSLFAVPIAVTSRERTPGPAVPSSPPWVASAACFTSVAVARWYVPVAPVAASIPRRWPASISLPSMVVPLAVRHAWGRGQKPNENTKNKGYGLLEHFLRGSGRRASAIRISRFIIILCEIRA